MIPDIVLHKIYWYKWRHLMNQLCGEYHENVKDTTTLEDGSCGVLMCRAIRWWNNRRFSYGKKRGTILNLTQGWNSVANLPPNYYYSNGTIERGYMVNGRFEEVYDDPRER